MEKAIKRAIEEGWNIVGTLGVRLPTKEFNFVNKFNVSVFLIEKTWIEREGKYVEVNMVSTCPPEKVLLDPLFWQALGKAEGWDKKYIVTMEEEDGGHNLFAERDVPTWKYYWYRFVDHLCEGGDVDFFFKSLII